MTPHPGSDRLGRRISRNAAVQAAGVVVGAIVSLVTFAAIARGLGTAGFGDFAAATAYLAIPTLLVDSGMTTVTVRDLARHPGRVPTLIATSLIPRGAVSVLVVVIAVCLSRVIPLTTGMREAILIGSTGAVLGLVGGAFVPVLQAELRMAWNVVATLAGRVVTLVVTLVALSSSGGLESVMWAAVAGVGVTAAIQVIVVAPQTGLRPRVDLAYWRRFCTESLTLGIATGTGLVYWRIDSILIAAFRGSREIGLYAAAYKFVDLAGSLVSGIYTSVFPSLTRFAQTGDPRLRGLVQKSFDVLMTLAAPGAVLGLLYAPDILVLIAGEEFRDGAVALQVLAFAPMVSFVSGLLERGLLAAGRERTILGMNVGVLVANIALNLILLPRFGFVAAAVTTLVTEIGWLGTAMHIFRRQFGFLPGVRPLAGLAIATAVLALLALTVPGPPLVGAMCGLVAFVAICATVPGTPRDIISSVRSRPTFEVAR